MLKRAGAFMVPWVGKGLLWGVLHYGLWAWDKFFEFVLYPIALINLGLVGGTALMMTLSFLICLALLMVYDWVSTHWVRDALGLETVKQGAERFEMWLTSKWPFRNLTPGGATFRALRFWVISLWLDPMTCVVFLRPTGMHRMDKREWKIFLSSTLVSNIAWALIVALGVETLSEVWPAAWEFLHFS